MDEVWVSRKTVIQAHIKDMGMQSCSLNIQILSPFLFEFIKGEYIRVCALCISNGVKISCEEKKVCRLQTSVSVHSQTHNAQEEQKKQ